MREILFRGKQVNSDKWEYGYLVQKNSLGAAAICNESQDPTCWGSIVIPETVGQYTGLTDKNGKKIFEGDIVKEPDTVHKGEMQIPGKTMKVVMQFGCWFASDGECGNQLGLVHTYWEVIGNIHDNPELIGGIGDG